ncbi:biosynthetic-type acetolactate synthase large subunit [Candidatus Woesearchaeota archaeon]|nr:biosynthetic-type acetolactate synthase large subunit [Candidatus Woesearchaeota archaeon]
MANNNNGKKTSEIIIDTLIKQRVKHIFGYPGAAVIPLFDELLKRKNEIYHVLVRHEQCAVHAADGYARSSGKTGVCIATSGPGATNLITGITNAYMDSIPLIVITGQVSTKKIASDAFQEADMMGITLPITKHNFQIRSADKAEEILLKAFRIATEGRPGPVYIELPIDVQYETKLNNEKSLSNIQGFNPVMKGNSKQIKTAAELISKSKKPLFFIGGGVILSDACNELHKLISLSKIPVVTTLMGKASFPETNELCLGLIGMQGRKCANYAVQNSDLLIIAGSRLSDRATGKFNEFAKKAKIIHIDIDPAEIGKNIPAEVPIVGDVKSVLSDLFYALSRISNKMPYKNWTGKLIRMNKKCSCSLDINSKLISHKKVLYELQNILNDKDIIVTGVGQHQMFAAHFLKRNLPRTFITSGGLGTMGFGLPAAIGAKIANPEKRVFLLDGDGSFQMTLQELATIMQENIKIIPIIFNNSYLGMVAQWLRLFNDNKLSNVSLQNPDFVKLAEAYSLNGIKVTRSDEIKNAIDQSINEKNTTVVEIKVNPDEDILPMLKSNTSLDKLFGPCVPDNYFKEE